MFIVELVNSNNMNLLAYVSLGYVLGAQTRQRL